MSCCWKVGRLKYEISQASLYTHYSGIGRETANAPEIIPVSCGMSQTLVFCLPYCRVT